MNTASRYQSWGRYPKLKEQCAVRFDWLPERLDIPSGRSVLAYGRGRSYGDACLNESGLLLDMAGCDRLLGFNQISGTIVCEAGVTLDAIIRCCLPRGWFLPVVPGTKYVTVGGAIANDIHGKNHHRAGTFGRYVTWLELLRSDGSRLRCSPQENSAIFSATIGGLGLTGLILRAEIQLKAVRAATVIVEKKPFGSLGEFFELSRVADTSHEYTVAWLDCMSIKGERCRGIFMSGSHSEEGSLQTLPPASNRIGLAFDCPSWLLNRWSIKGFNRAYYWLQGRSRDRAVSAIDPFFFPLDAIGSWNRLYGQSGFVQYQFVLPVSAGLGGLSSILSMISQSNLGSFLAVLKLFGSVESPGLLSFPLPGVTFALDFPLHGGRTLALLERLDQIVLDAGGRIYPAKDARMTPASFQRSFPQWREFLCNKDAAFSSSFWRRVTPKDAS